ncbi:MAG: polysaccharide biosynthesis/export family protein [Bryobacteraceae bacterium]
MTEMKVLRIASVVLCLFALPVAAQEASEPVPHRVDTPAAAPDLTEAAKGPGAPVDPRTYKIGPEDVVVVRVWREPELSGAIVVRPDGKIAMPLIGEVEAAGATPEELNGRIIEALSKFMNRPEVTVAIQQVNSKKYYISGEVFRPGAFPLVTPTTVLSALTNAGGFREFANTKKITILRGTERLKFNYRDVIKGKNTAQNVLLEPDDHIIVP